MIFDYIFTMFINAFTSLIDSLPIIGDFTIPSGILDYALQIIAMANIVFPVPDILTIFAIKISLVLFLFAYNILFKLWGALPFT